MNTAAIVLFSLYGLYSIIHLVFCFFEDEKLRKITKVPCLVLLGVACVLSAPKEPLIYLGCLFAAIGDYFLIWNKVPKKMLIGQIFFLIAHLLFLSKIILLIGNPKWWQHLIGLVLIIGIGFATIPFTKKTLGKLGVFGNFYLTSLVITFIVACIYGIGGPIEGKLLAVSYFVFVCSDILVALTTYIKDIKRRDFYIMATYLIACFGIVFCLVQASI